MYQIFHKPIISAYLKSKGLEWAGFEGQKV